MNEQDEARDRDAQADADRQDQGDEHGPPANIPDAPRPEERPPSEVQAEIDLLKSSGGDPLTQESD